MIFFFFLVAFIKTSPRSCILLLLIGNNISTCIDFYLQNIFKLGSQRCGCVVNKRMDNRSGARVEKKFRIGSEISKRRKK